MTEPSATPAAILAARARLSAGRAALLARPVERTLESLGELLDQWRAPGSAACATLEAELSGATGLHAETIRDGLERALAQFTGEALRALHRAEQHAAGAAQLAGFAETSVFLAGSIPMPTLTALLFPLLLHSPVLAKTASRDPITARVFASSLAEIDPDLARCIEVVSFASDDAACTRALLASECVVATGSDETIEALARDVPATTRFVGYGHRLSVAVVGREALTGDALEDLAVRLARDVAAWDQQGCLSPVAIYCEGGPDEARALGRAIGGALADAETRWPRGSLAKEAASAIRRERDEASMRAADGRDVAVYASAGTEHTVVVEEDLRWRPAPLHRFVRIHPAREREALFGALAELGKHLAGVALAGFGDASPEIARALGQLGASRVCEPGCLQAPPLGWHHDGQLLLAPLARLTDIERTC